MQVSTLLSRKGDGQITEIRQSDLSLWTMQGLERLDDAAAFNSSYLSGIKGELFGIVKIFSCVSRAIQ